MSRDMEFAEGSSQSALDRRRSLLVSLTRASDELVRIKEEFSEYFQRFEERYKTEEDNESCKIRAG